MSFNNKNILITGGTGSFGEIFLNSLLKNYNPKKIIIFSRDEMKQFYLEKKISSEKVRFFLGDVRDLERLKLAMKEVDIVVHAAALKIVPKGEYDSFEFVKTNIIGAMNVITASIEMEVKKVIALSTDKACQPTNLYGGTKFISDKLFVNANFYSGRKKTLFSVVRYGNVLGSRGSIIPFLQSIKNSKSIPITHPKMSRFLVKLKDAVDLVAFTSKKMIGGEIFVLKCPSVMIVDLAKVIIPNAPIKYIGIRPGEKIDEMMISLDESRRSREFKNHYIIYSDDIYKKINKKDINNFGKKLNDNFTYSSLNNSNWLSGNSLKTFISEIS